MSYLPLRISTVKAEKDLPFDLFIFFKETYLEYVSKGLKIPQEKFDKLVTQDIATFWIPSDQVDNYYTYLDKTLDEVVMNDKISPEEKLEVTEGAASSALENLQQGPQTEESFNMTKKAANSFRQVVSQNPKMLKKLFGRKAKESDSIIKHSLNVCALATKLAEEVGTKESDLEDLATAALIHDIGITLLKEEERMLFLRPKKNFGPTDKRIYNFHVKESVQKLTSKPYINKNIEELVLHHEENLSGTGPFKMTKLTKSEEILCLVNAYDKKIITEKMTPSEALKDFTIEEVGNFNLDLIQSFKKVIKELGL
ncbi:MAG: HD domain-containing protein [Halobacteriovoraceae bacterium]|nr:HD domain-containing protein [Halobacteriovoraceae bacterium]